MPVKFSDSVPVRPEPLTKTPIVLLLGVFRVLTVPMTLVFCAVMLAFQNR